MCTKFKVVRNLKLYENFLKFRRDVLKSAFNIKLLLYNLIVI
jgi:hypothetical protein